jgi:Transposase IS66 family
MASAAKILRNSFASIDKGQFSPERLLQSLENNFAQVLGFMDDFEVPFDNHQAERDLRMMKLKQPISGRCRAEEGATMFCRIRGYLSTFRPSATKLGCWHTYTQSSTVKAQRSWSRHSSLILRYRREKPSFAKPSRSTK